jgi:hypothetical protein
MSNELGLRKVAFEVDDLQAAVDGLAADGYGMDGGIPPAGLATTPRQRCCRHRSGRASRSRTTNLNR